MEVLRFGMVGVAATAVHFGVLVLLHDGLGVEASLATVLAFLVALNVSYFGQRLWVFCPSEKRPGEVARFAGVASLGAALNAGSMMLVVDVLGAYYILGFLTGTVAVPLITFLLNKFWVFGVSR